MSKSAKAVRERVMPMSFQTEGTTDPTPRRLETVRRPMWAGGGVEGQGCGGGAGEGGRCVGSGSSSRLEASVGSDAEASGLL